MLEVVLLSQLVVAVVLAVSGVAKLLDAEGTADAAIAFGLPERHAGWFSRVLPATELLVAALLIAQPASRVGTTAALFLLAGFTVAVAENLRRGRRPECHCFGRLGSSDISGRTIVRNVALLLLAAAGLLAEPVSWVDYIAQQSGSAVVGVVLTALSVAVAIVVGEAAASRRSAAASREPADASAGAAPGFTLAGLTGDMHSLHDLLDGQRPLLLAFLSPGCGPCRRLRPVVSRWGEVFSARLRIVVVTTGGSAANIDAFGGSGLTVLLDDDRVVAEAYGVPSRPAAVLISRDGLLLGPIVAGDVGVRALVGGVISGDVGLVPEQVPADALTLSSAPGPRATVTVEARDESTSVVTDEVSGASAALDPIASIIWQCLDGRSPLEEIVRDIADGFGAPAEVIEQDVLRLVRHLGGLGLLTGVAVDSDAGPAAALAQVEPMSV